MLSTYDEKHHRHVFNGMADTIEYLRYVLNIIICLETFMWTCTYTTRLMCRLYRLIKTDLYGHIYATACAVHVQVTLWRLTDGDVMHLFGFANVLILWLMVEGLGWPSMYTNLILVNNAVIFVVQNVRMSLRLCLVLIIRAMYVYIFVAFDVHNEIFRCQNASIWLRAIPKSKF